MTAAAQSTWSGPNWTNTDFQSVVSYHCHNCPIGPYIDYSNLQYDANLFELPCTTKGIAWRFRDVYSNQGCPAWDPNNPSAQNSCTWTTVDSMFYGGSKGLDYCITTLDAFTPDEPVYTFQNQMSFLGNTGRSVNNIQKTTNVTGDSGVPPLYVYSGNTASNRQLWKDYWNTSADVGAAVSSYQWFADRSGSALSIYAGTRRHLLEVAYKATFLVSTTTYMNIGACQANVKNYWNNDIKNPQTTSTPGTNMNSGSGPPTNKACLCYAGSNGSSFFCHAGAPICIPPSSSSSPGCYSETKPNQSNAINAG